MSKNRATIVDSTAVAMLLALQMSMAGAVAREPMSERQAGREYLASACDLVAAIDKNRAEVYGEDNWITFEEAEKRLEEIKGLTRPYARAYFVSARALLNPPGAWPRSVDDLVETSARQMLRINTLLRRAVTARTAERWLNLTNRAHKITWPSATIRARLDLPPPGSGCDR